MPILGWTYATLLQALQDWPVHASVLYLNNVPNLIGLGERRLWGDLNIEEYDKDDLTSVQTVVGNRAVSKPADVIVVRNAAIIVAGAYTPLEKRSLDYCKAFAPVLTVQAPPQFYSELNQGQIYVVPTPDAIYQMNYHYLGSPPETLTPTAPNSSTWLSRAGPDALLSACLAEAEHFIKADDRYQDMINKYTQELLPRLRAELRRSIRAGDPGPLRAAPAPVEG